MEKEIAYVCTICNSVRTFQEQYVNRVNKSDNCIVFCRNRCNSETMHKRKNE